MKSDTLSVVDKITTKTGEIATKIEKSTVSSLDEFITKYEPSISSKLGSMWEFFKETSKSAFDAFYRYLLVRESFPVVLTIIGLIIGYFLYKKIISLLPKEDTLFPLLEEKDDMSYLEKSRIRDNNSDSNWYRLFYRIIPLAVYLFITYIAIDNIILNIYNLVQLFVAPEAKILVEIYNLYKQ